MPNNHPNAHPQEKTASSWLWPVAVGTAALAGAVMLAPSLLPLMGVGDRELAVEATTAMHVEEGVNGTGVAGAINNILASVPLIGSKLAEGGIFAGIASAGIGLGGLKLSQYLDSKETGNCTLSAGKLVKYLSLATSALIALPSLITGIGIGIVYLAGALGDNELASSVATKLFNTSGTSHKLGANVAALGLVSGLSHLATCGAPLIPLFADMSSAPHPASAPPAQPEIPPGISPEPETNPNYTDGSIRAAIRTSAPTEAGKPATATLTLTDNAGSPVTPEKLAVTHTKKMHLFLVDETLRDFQHLHPEPTQTPGEYSFTFTPATPNNYSAWTDITLNNGQQHRLKTELESALDRPARAHVLRRTESISGNLAFQLKTDGPLRKDTPATLEVNVTDKAGNPVTDLEPLLGASAHLVGFSADGKSIIHAHPLDNTSGSTLRFAIEPDFAGAAQLYLQVRHNGHTQTAQFGQQVFPALQSAQQLAARPQHSAHHSM